MLPGLGPLLSLRLSFLNRRVELDKLHWSPFSTYILELWDELASLWSTETLPHTHLCVPNSGNIETTALVHVDVVIGTVSLSLGTKGLPAGMGLEFRVGVLVSWAAYQSIGYVRI